MSTTDTDTDLEGRIVDISARIEKPGEIIRIERPGLKRLDDDLGGDEEVKLDMSVEVKVVSVCERVVEVTIPRTEVDRYFRVEFDELINYAHIPGFRQGKVPRSIVEKKYRREVQDQVKRKLVSDAVSLLNGKIEIVPISEPRIDVETYNIPPEGDFIFNFPIEVRPDFELPEWKGIKVENPVRVVSGEDVDKEVKLIIAEYGTLIPTDTPVELGNYIETKVTVEIDGVAINSGAYSESETICVRKRLSFYDCVIENFGELVTGAKVGDKIKTKVTITKLTKRVDVRDKVVDVTFEVLGVKRIELPEMTPELLQRLGNYTDEADFRDAVLDKLKKQMSFSRQSRIRQQLTNTLATMEWELPAELLARQSEREFNRLRYELVQSGYSDSYIASQENLLRTNANNATEKALREHFVLERIAEAEGIVETEEDYTNEIALLARQFDISPRKLRANIEKNGQSDLIRNQVIERKVLDLISQHAEFVEVPFEFEQIDTTAVSWAITSKEPEINEASEEDLKAVHKEMEYKKNFDPNMRIN
ncbi:MAG: trigger factor [Planctomycetaceae bacterium]|jgi:trigger factor|nr:trigger factor [Planctomycetaceae bacterium]